MSKSVRVLFVEDDENDALLVVDELERGGLTPIWERVETMEAMRAALDRGKWEIIIADNSLPHFSGAAALALAQQVDPDLPYILISGHLREEESVQALRSGARDFISKRNMARLVPAIVRELREAEVRRERRHVQEQLREEQDHKLEFHRRLILAATNDKLVITEPGEIERVAGPALKSWEIHSAEDLPALRSDVCAVAVSEGMDERSAGRFAISIGEAIANAVRHAGGGSASLHRRSDGLMFVISDKGTGIADLSLPEVALRQGYSTAGTLGMGYKIMIRVSDRVYLSSSRTGTTVGILMGLQNAEHGTQTPG